MYVLYSMTFISTLRSQIYSKSKSSSGSLLVLNETFHLLKYTFHTIALMRFLSMYVHIDKKQKKKKRTISFFLCIRYEYY